MAEPDFDREEFETWLKGYPPKVAVALASRAAMRVLPVVGRHVPATEATVDTVFLPLFRANSQAWLFVDHRVHASVKRVHAIAAFAYAAADAARIASSSDAVRDASSSVAAAADAAFAAEASVEAAFIDAVEAATDAAAAASAAGSVFAAAALRSDRNAIEAGVSAVDLAIRPLWPEKTDESARDWAKIREGLLALDPNWSVWTDWYDDRLAGRPADLEFEIARANLPEELWDEDAAAVNAELVRIREGFLKGGDDAAAPPEDTDRGQDAAQERAAAEALWSYEQALKIGGALTFTGTFITLDIGGEVSDAQAARLPLVATLHPRLRQLADRLAETCRRRLHNYPEWQSLREDASALKALIDSDLQDIAGKIAEVWALSVALAGLAEADASKPYDESNRLPKDIRTELGSLGAVLGPWLRNFPTASDLDDAHREWVAAQGQIASARSVARIADEHQLLLARIANLLDLALHEGQGEGVQARKSGNWGVGTVKRIALIALLAGGAVTSGYLQKLGADVQDASILAEKAKRTIMDAEADLIELMSDAPVDIRQAVAQLLDVAKASTDTPNKDD